MIVTVEGIDGHAEQLVGVFKSSFAASEGAKEGEVIAELVRCLFTKTAPEDLNVFSLQEGNAFLACIVFSKLTYAEDERSVVLLSPVAVVPSRQNEGLGKKLLTFGLAAIAAKGADVAITYGNPKYYAKVAFVQITAAIARPPFPLSQPHGWLAQSLTDKPLTPQAGDCQCVPAFDNADHW